MADFNKLLASFKDYTKQNPSQATALCAVIVFTSFLLYRKFKKHENVFTDMLPYRKNSPNEYGDPKLTSKIKRCSKPTQELEIVYSKKGVASTKTATLPQLFYEAVENGGDEKCWGKEIYDPNTDKWVLKYWTWNEYKQLSELVSLSLIGLGLEKFSIVNLYGFCTPRYIFCQIGCILANILPAGVYTTCNSGQIKYVSNLSKTSLVFVDTKVRANKYLGILNELDTVKYIVIFNDKTEDQNIDDIKSEYEKGNNKNRNNINILNWNEFVAYSLKNEINNYNTLKNRKSNQNPKQCALISYTSGTTGFSKAVMSSHDNIWFQCLTINKSVFDFGGKEREKDEARQVCYLPLSHVAGQILYIFNPFITKARIAPKLKNIQVFARPTWKTTLFDTVRAVKPTNFFGVPRMYEKFHERMSAAMEKSGFIKKLLIKFIMSNGLEYYKNIQYGGSGKIPKWWPFIQKYLCNGLIKKKLGFQHCKSFISAGAPLNPKIREFFGSLDMIITDGYGMTEVTGGCVGTRLNNFLATALGPSLEGCEVKVEHVKNRDPEGHGEICFRGRSVMMGYLFEMEKTLKIIDSDGYLHSGDVGYFKDNCLFITGRIKELIITAGGENIAPVPVEHYIKQLCPNVVSHCIMIGDKRKYCSLLVSLCVSADENGNPTNKLTDNVSKFCSNVKTVYSVIDNKNNNKNNLLYSLIRNGIKKYNSDENICVSNACKIQYFCIIHKDLSVIDGTLSATLKMKRRQIYDMYKNEIDSMYGDKPEISVRG